MKPQHLALALLIAVIWGFTFITAKVGVTSFPPIFFTTLRFGLVAIVLLPWLRLLPGRMGPICLVGLLAGCLHFSLFYSGMAISGSTSAVAVLVQLGAPFGIVLAVVWLKERVDVWRVLGIALAFGGVLVLGFDPAVFDHPLGTFLVILAAFVMSTAMVLMRRLRNVGVFELQAWIATLSAPPLLAASLLFETGHLEPVRALDWMAMGAVLFTALATSIVGHGGWFYLIQRYPVGQVTGFGLLPPVLGVVFSVIFLDESVTWKLAVAAVMVVGGIAIITFAPASDSVQAPAAKDRV